MNCNMRTIAGAAAVFVLFGAGLVGASEQQPAQVLFVCERGNVKSLMAASYFNQLAKERGLPFRGVARGLAPDSTTVPQSIATALNAEGFDVSDFRPIAVSAADLSDSERIVLISTKLPTAANLAPSKLEQWDDVPPASTNYAAARDSLRSHVREIIERLAR